MELITATQWTELAVGVDAEPWHSSVANERILHPRDDLVLQHPIEGQAPASHAVGMQDRNQFASGDLVTEETRYPAITAKAFIASLTPPL